MAGGKKKKSSNAGAVQPVGGVTIKQEKTKGKNKRNNQQQTPVQAVEVAKMGNAGDTTTKEVSKDLPSTSGNVKRHSNTQLQGKNKTNKIEVSENSLEQVVPVMDELSCSAEAVEELPSTNTQNEDWFENSTAENNSVVQQSSTPHKGWHVSKHEESRHESTPMLARNQTTKDSHPYQANDSTAADSKRRFEPNQKQNRSDYGASKKTERYSRGENYNSQRNESNWNNRTGRSGYQSRSSERKSDCEWRQPENRHPDQSGWDVNAKSTKSKNVMEPNRNYSGNVGDRDFEDYKKFRKGCTEKSYTKVEEIQQDLFEMPEEYALAHCVAEDMNMGSGIAVQFSQKFKSRDELYKQRQKQGGLAVLNVGKEQRYVYYLVTKRESNGKPTLFTMWSSLKKLQQHMQEHEVKKLAIPRIGCGLDRLEWSDVKPMIEYIFRDTDCKITVCNFQQPEGESSSSAPRSRKCPVKNVTYPLVDIAELTIIVYLGTEDGYVSEEMKSLDRKFNFIGDYKRASRQLGKLVINYKMNDNYCLCGFIIKKSERDPFDFEHFQRCVMELKKVNRKDCYGYVGIQAFLDEDELIMNKIVNILRHTLIDVEVYVCWPGKMQNYMPQERRNDYY